MAAGTLDTALDRETPEGISLELRPAGMPVRVAAFLIDLAIRVAIFTAVATVAGLLGNFGMGTMLITAFALEWLYPVAFELRASGATPGKAALRLKVVMDTGLPVTPGASLVRNLLRTADFMPLVYGLGLLCMVMRSDFRRIGDIGAGTLVVHRQPIPPRGKPLQVTPRPPAIALSPREQAVVMALAARAPTLTGDRLRELATMAVPVLGDKLQHGSNPTEQVLGVAQWLLGRRA